MRIVSPGHAVFAAVMIALGIQGLIKGDFTVVWAPVPKSAPVREALVYLSASISLASGIGLLLWRTAALAARLLLASLILWLLLWRVRALSVATLVDSSWSCGETLAMMAATWVLFATFAADWHQRRIGFVTGEKGRRIAQVLYALALIPFGYAHFAYLKHPADMVPRWLPWHLGWAYFTGATFIAASSAILFGVFAWLAAALSAIQMGLFGLLVWVPVLAAGHSNAFQQDEFAVTIALTAAGWVVAESYKSTRVRQPLQVMQTRRSSAPR